MTVEMSAERHQQKGGVGREGDDEEEEEEADGPPRVKKTPKQFMRVSVFYAHLSVSPVLMMKRMASGPSVSYRGTTTME